MSGWRNQERRILRQHGLRVAADIVRVVVEEGVLHVRLELLFAAHAGRRHHDRRRRIHRHARRCVGRAASAARHQMIGGRRGRRHGLHAHEGTSPMPSIETRRRVGRAPGQNAPGRQPKSPSGVAVICAVGAGADVAAEPSPKAGGGGLLLATCNGDQGNENNKRRLKTRKRRFKGILLP